MYIKTLFLFLALTLLTACGAAASPSAKSSINKDAAMSWLNSPPSDTSSYFYAVGYGKTQKDAKSDALSTISSKISVNVASNFSNSVTATRQGSDEQIINNTKSEVVSKSKNIEYTDVKIVESYNDGKQWILLVEVDRAILTKTYERKLSKVDSNIKAEWEIFQSASVFEKLKLSATIEDYLSETDSIFPLLHSLDVNYDDSQYTSRYMNYTKEMRKAKKELVFKIKSDANSEPLASLVRSELSAQNAIFSDSNFNVLISITTKAKKKKYRSTNAEFAQLTFALRKTDIKATDRSGNVVSNVVYKTKEGSSEGFEDALARTAKYEKKIAQLGIINFITGKK